MGELFMNKKRVVAICLAAGVAAQSLFSITTFAIGNENIIYQFDATTGKYDTTKPIKIHGNDITAPTVFQNQKEQFRTAWVATVARIDYPSKATYDDNVLNLEELKRDYLTVLDRYDEYKLNAVTFQVSPMLDAWYKSDIVPWTQYLHDGNYTSQGHAPVYGEDFDLLGWMIDETHKRGMEFHAWFNPYRVTNDAADSRTKEDKLKDLADNNFAKLHPDMVYMFQNKLFLDPGRPEVVDYVTRRVKEVVEKYKVDAIHFDDYFYPYKYSTKDSNGASVDIKFSEVAPDKATFENAKYSRNFTEINKWREDNINLLIKSVRAAIDNENTKNGKSIQYGISPFGIWAHNAENPAGSHTPTPSTSSYRDQFADTRRWAKEGWVDYLTPQIYWGFQTTAAPYGELLDWWNEQFEGVTNSQLYIGHANYKHAQSWVNEFKNPEEIGTQLRFNQKYTNVKGSGFFSLDTLIPKQSAIAGDTNDITNKAQTVLKNHLTNLANVPAKPWLDKFQTVAVNSLSMDLSDASQVKLTWKDNNKDSKFYCVYRQDGDLNQVDLTNSNNLIHRSGVDAGLEFVDKSIEAGKTYTYAVTIIDNSGVESVAATIQPKSNAAIDSIVKIPGIDVLTLNDEAAVIAARKLVTAANNDSAIGNLEKLVSAESKIKALKDANKTTEEAQLAKEKAAIDAITKLPEVSDITLNHEAVIISTRELVTVANKDSSITNLHKLVDAEAKLKELKNVISNGKGNGEIPKTGGTSATAVVGLGSIIAAAGTVLLKKRK